MYYFNNAATTWPKPEIVYQSVDDAFRNLNSPERTAGADGKRSSALLQTCRAEVAEFFGIQNPDQLVFTPSCTYSLNLAILCQDWQPGDVVLISGMEHHAMSRPVRKLARERGIEFKVIPYREGQPLDLQFLQAELETGKVKMVGCTMASNVTGEILPSEEVGQLCHRYEVRYLVDAAQSAGVLPVDVHKLNCDFMSFAGSQGALWPSWSWWALCARGNPTEHAGRGRHWQGFGAARHGRQFPFEFRSRNAQPAGDRWGLRRSSLAEPGRAGSNPPSTRPNLPRHLSKASGIYLELPFMAAWILQIGRLSFHLR